jgi:hypothetical protein
LAVVIGEGLWATWFARDPAVVGRAVKVGTAPATIVGVMPDRFGFPVNQQLWLPLRADGSLLAPRTGPPVSIFGRLAPGVSLQQAQAELDAIAKGLAATNPEAYKNLNVSVVAYGTPPIEGAETVVKFLYAANGIFLLLLAVICTNVATLVLARTATRGWEVAVRAPSVPAAAASSRSCSPRRSCWPWSLPPSDRRRKAGAALGTQHRRRHAAILGDRQSLADHRALRWTADPRGGGDRRLLPALRVTRLNVLDSLRREQAASANLRFGGMWTTAIVVQVAITVALLPLAAVGIIASNRFGQRAEGVGADRYLTAAVAFERQNRKRVRRGCRTRTPQLAELERRLRADFGVSR